MDEIISYKMCAVKVRNAKLRNYLKAILSLETQKACQKTVWYLVCQTALFTINIHHYQIISILFKHADQGYVTSSVVQVSYKPKFLKRGSGNGE